jgi:hypothetical protein
LIVREAVVLERVLGVAGPLDVLFDEGVLIHDEGAAGLQVAEVGHQRRRVHRNEHVGLVARRQDILVREMDLERGYTCERAGRRADLGREVREGCEVVAEDGGCIGEALAGELHTVTGVACEADDYLMEFFNGLRLTAPFPFFLTQPHVRKPPPDVFTRRPRKPILRAFAPPP